MFLVGENIGFAVYFNTEKQEYIVYKDKNLLVSNKYKFADVKSYLD